MLEEFSLTQHFIEATRQSPANTLELVITNLNHRLTNVSVIPDISDRDIPTADTLMKPVSTYQNPCKIWLDKKSNWDGMQNHLGVILSRIESAYQISSNGMWSEIKQGPRHGKALYHLNLPNKNMPNPDSPQNCETSSTPDGTSSATRSTSATKVRERLV